jgi:hypothetical protein
MSAQLRYHTLVNNIGRIYSSEEKERTQYLQKGLDEIVGAIRPTTSDDWKRVKTDSDRLLKIWNVKENTDAASSVVVDQIRDMLLELSSAAASSVSYPALKQQTLQNHQNHPTLEVSEKIAHVQEPLFASFVKTVPSSAPASTIESKATEAEEEEEEEEIRVVVLSVSESKEGKEADEEEEVEEDEEEEVEEEEEEEEVEEEVVEPEEEEVEEEVVEPEEEAEEAEEEGLEVEQITIRGRTYWLDVNTKKLYANLEGDDVGDEVGAMVNGKAVFLAK